jgi:hypothetical protein
VHHGLPKTFPAGLLAIGVFAAAQASGADAVPTYNKDIRPILSDKCFKCHGPDSATREGDLRLDIRQDALDSDAFVPGNSKGSAIIKRILHHDPDEVMPPPDAARQLNATEKETLAKWIDAGAAYEEHWSFSPLPDSIPVPKPKDSAWAKSDLDRFIAHRLDLEQLTPTPPASRERWLRRTTFDLTGLPPTKAEVDAFLADSEPGAKERVTDRLLASPRYGEKMASGWLDVARYADSFGYQTDLDTNAWPYRDWVIRAFNNNLPWDQFITWQLAGDMLPNATRDQQVATAFNRIHRKTQEGGSIEAEFRDDGLSDRVHTVGTAFLGLTFECTRCHDHKYDPLTQKDYYSLGAFFNSIDEWGLLSGNTGTPPNPTLLLTSPEQDKTIAQQTEAIAQGENALQAKRKEKEAAFQEWIKAPTAPLSDLGASYDLDAASGNNFANAIDAETPAVSNQNNKSIPGKLSQGLSLTGDDPLVLGPKWRHNREDAVSLAFWLNPGPGPKRRVVFHNSVGADAGYSGIELVIENSKLRWSVVREWPGNCISIETAETIPDTEWTHVAVTYDGSSRANGLSLFVNGQPAKTEVVRDHLKKNSGSSNSYSFGERFRDSGLRGGAVDAIHLYKRAITALEIEAIHANRPLTEHVSTLSRDHSSLAKLRDYYFSAVDEDCRKLTADLQVLRQALRKTLDGVGELPIMREMKEARPAFLLARGAYDAPEGEPLKRETPAALPPMPPDLARDRLGFAQWLTMPDHPLTARVQVNRVWQHFFDRGLVATSENFGIQGELPSHPELLDWLARDFIASGWDMKRLCRNIVLSATYSQDSKATPALREKDPSNLLLARGPAKRLTAEDLRDQALALSHLMVPTIGGPSVRPYIPESAVLANGLVPYNRDAAPHIYRRTLYTFWRRTAPPPGMLAFDFPSREVCSVKRQQTNTPLQPLVMLNDPQFVEASRALGVRMMREGNSDPDWVFRETLNRFPDENESRLLKELYESQLEIFRNDPVKAQTYLRVGDMAAPPDLPAIELATCSSVANAILNLDEAITLR